MDQVTCSSRNTNANLKESTHLLIQVEVKTDCNLLADSAVIKRVNAYLMPLKEQHFENRKDHQITTTPEIESREPDW